MTYLVMECHPAYAIVLDQSGRVIRVANMGYEPGQRLGDVVALRTPPVPLRLRLAPLAAAACLCMAIFGGGTYGAFFFPYGSVQIQINPDVRMSVSYMDRVVGLEGLNEDGARLISQVSYKGKNAVKMSEVLVDRAVDMGYLGEGGTVSVKVRGSTRWREKREASITSGLEHLMKGRMDVEIKALSPDAGNNPDTAQGADAQTRHPSTEDMLPPNYPVAAPATPGEARWGYWGDDEEDDEDDRSDGKLGHDDENEEEDNGQDDGEEDRDRDGDDGDEGLGRDLDDQDDEDGNRNGDDRAEHDEDKRHEKAEHDEDGGKKPHKVNNDGSMNANGDKEGSVLQQSPMQQADIQQTDTQQTNQKEGLENNQNEAGGKEDDRNQDWNDKQDDKQDKDQDDSHDQKENEDDGNGGNDDDSDEMDDD